MELGNTIRRLREARGWSQEELAFRTQTSTANISRIENGRHGPGDTLLLAISNAFDLRIFQLIALAEGITLPEIPSEPHPEEAELLRHFRVMHRSQQALFIRVGEQFAHAALKTAK